MLWLVTAIPPGAPVVLKPGMVIDHSVAVAKRTYDFSTPQGETQAGDETIPTFTPAIVIRGKKITVDFAGATLQGTPQTVLPDQRKGLAIQIEGDDITIKNIKVHGYKVGLIARNCRRLKILNSDFSYNWKQHLHSTLEREDESDWQSYHHNEHDEWLRYGAGIYLADCNIFEVAGVRIRGGQCGLMLNRCRGGHVFGNDFSFLSGVGLGLYRTSFTTAEWNKIDWCVRGFSYGVYNRGQDSAGILVFEQSSNNVFFQNSVTHGGDGFFLWAGQQTMDTGKGGCNDNLLRNNDFSHSPANGIEATFSRNRFVNNKLLDCWHGIWGGYSYSTDICGNVFGLDGQGVAIEHGQGNLIRDNLFANMSEAIDIWADPNNDPKFGYRKRGDIDSHDLDISGNYFTNISQVAAHLRETRDVKIEGNTFAQPTGVWVQDGSRELTHSDDLGRLGITVDLKQDGVKLFTRADLILTLTNETPIQLHSGLDPSGQPIRAYRLDRDAYLRQFDVPWDWNGNPVHPMSPPPHPAAPKGDEFPDVPVNHWAYASEGGVVSSEPFLGKGTLRGQRYILVDEWGPYDFQSPIIWPRQMLTMKSGVERRRFEILGPKGRWRVVDTEGVSNLSKRSGLTTDYLDADIDLSHTGTTKIALEYIGAQTTDFRGIVTAAGRPVRFAYSRFRMPIHWDVSFYRWTQSENPSDPHAAPRDFPAVLATAQIQQVKTDELNFAGGSLVPGLPDNHYGTLAVGKFTAPAGDYTLELTTDDGARVSLDGKPLITDAWHYQGPTTYTKPIHLTPGPHTLRVEHFQIDGYAALKVALRPASP